MPAGRFASDVLAEPRYTAFAIDVANGSTPSRAAREHRISSPVRTKLMRNPRVLAYIEEIRARNMEELQLERKDVVHGIVDAIQDAKILNEPSTQIRGWEVLAKMLGFNEPERHQHVLKGEIEVVERRIKDMSTAELLAQMNHINTKLQAVDAEVVEACPEERTLPSQEKSSTTTTPSSKAQSARARSSKRKSSKGSSSASSKSAAGGRRKS